jgi:SAM-dependent methyltransferase
VKAHRLITGPGLLLRSLRARRQGRRAGIPGLEFDSFGRRLGLRLMLSGQFGLGASYFLNPVSIVRYFEFPFVAASVPAGAGICADVSSPRLFSLFWSATHPGARIEMINPDRTDLEQTRLVAASARIPLDFVNTDLRVFRSRPGRYDSIWSISVLEHVHGDYDDRDSIAWLYSALRPGGVMALTVTVDRVFWDEYRDADPYGLDRAVAGQVFFQRWYDLRAIRERLVDPLAGSSASLAFFGETRPGIFKAYEAEWARQGLKRSVEDPREIADNFSEFPTWESMPGKGVCGIRIVKPARISD